MLSSDWIRSLPPSLPIPVPSGARRSVGCLHVVAVLRSNRRAWHIEVECSEAENDAEFHFLPSVFK